MYRDGTRRVRAKKSAGFFSSGEERLSRSRRVLIARSAWKHDRACAEIGYRSSYLARGRDTFPLSIREGASDRGIR